MRALGDLVLRVSRILLLVSSLDQLLTKLRDTLTQLHTDLEKVNEGLESLEELYKEDLVNRLIAIDAGLTDVKDSFKDTVEGPLRRIDEFITQTLASAVERLNELVDGLIRTIDNLITGMVSELSKLTAAVGLMTDAIKLGARGIAESITQAAQFVGDKLTDFIQAQEGLKEEISGLKKKVEELPEQVAGEVANSIVGESYYRYDNTSNYYPTMIFLFNLVNGSPGAGRSQVKLRYPKLGTDISPEDIAKLKANVAALQGLSYSYGGNRLNFVSQDRKSKTVINVEDINEGQVLLERVCEAVGVPFDSSLITVTSENRRPPVNRRGDPLGTWKPRRTVNVKGVYELRRVRLYVNGMDGPYDLFTAKSSPPLTPS